MWLDDIVTLLQNAGIGTFNTNIFYSTKVSIPGGDGPYLQISETSGAPPEWTQDRPKPAYLRPSAQITVYATDYDSARAMSMAAWNALIVTNTQINGTWYREIRPLQNPFDDGSDEKERSRVRFNVIAYRRP
jgi:hypothetical protein